MHEMVEKRIFIKAGWEYIGRSFGGFSAPVVGEGVRWMVMEDIVVRERAGVLVEDCRVGTEFYSTHLIHLLTAHNLTPPTFPSNISATTS